VLAKVGPAAKQRRKGNDWKNDFFQGFSSEALQHLEDSFDLHGGNCNRNCSSFFVAMKA
jgi:hypothetical protein